MATLLSSYADAIIVHSPADASLSDSAPGKHCMAISPPSLQHLI